MKLDVLIELFRAHSLAVSIFAAAFVGTVSWLLMKIPSKVLDGQNVRPFPLLEKTSPTHNTRLFKIGIGEGKKLDLPVGKHVLVCAPAGLGKEVISRKYTPVSTNDTVGYFELLIKIYPAPGGLMGRYLDSLPLGANIDVKGPNGSFKYVPNAFKVLGMLAGGTGITPMWQVLMSVLNNPEDYTKIRLIFANVTEKDILLHDKLVELAKEKPAQFEVFFVLNEPPANWTGGTGFVTEQHIRDHIGTPTDGLQVLMCGPLPMNSAMRRHLMAIGFGKADVFAF